MIFDLKVINSVLEQLEQEKGIPKEKTIEAIEMTLASAYKKEYGEKGQIIRAKFDNSTGKTEYYQIKEVVDETTVKIAEEGEIETESPKTETSSSNTSDSQKTIKNDSDERVNFNIEHHIMLDDAKRIKKDAALGDEIVFPLEPKEDFGRIAAQTAKQTIIQKIREAEKISVVDEFEDKQGEIITGSVQRIEKGNIFIDIGRATGILPFEEQIFSERYKQGDIIRAYLYSVEETPKGVFLRLWQHTHC